MIQKFLSISDIVKSLKKNKKTIVSDVEVKEKNQPQIKIRDLKERK